MEDVMVLEGAPGAAKSFNDWRGPEPDRKTDLVAWTTWYCAGHVNPFGAIVELAKRVAALEAKD